MDAGFGQRVTQRLKALGYWKNGRPDIGRFSMDKGYIPSYVYRWRAGEVPRGAMLFRLASDLGLSAEALLIGPSGGPRDEEDGRSARRRRPPVPAAGGSTAKAPSRARTPRVVPEVAATRHKDDAVPLIRRPAAKVYRWLMSALAQPQVA